MTQRSTLLGAGGSKSRSRQANGANSRSLENVLASAERPDGASGNRKFESISLQRRVRLSPRAAFEGREPRLSARLCAAGWATRSAETRSWVKIAPTGGNISVAPYSSTAV